MNHVRLVGQFPLKPETCERLLIGNGVSASLPIPPEGVKSEERNSRVKRKGKKTQRGEGWATFGRLGWGLFSRKGAKGRRRQGEELSGDLRSLGIGRKMGFEPGRTRDPIGSRQ